MKKKYLSYLILATILILVSCTSKTADSTGTKTLNGACAYMVYENEIEQLNAAGACKISGNTLTIEFDPAIDMEGSKKVKKVLIDANEKSLTTTREDDSIDSPQRSTPSDPVTITVKADSWELFINAKLLIKVTPK